MAGEPVKTQSCASHSPVVPGRNRVSVSDLIFRVFIHTAFGSCREQGDHAEKSRLCDDEIAVPQARVAQKMVLGLELANPITPGFEALVFKASRGIEDIYELTYIRKDGSRFPAVVSVTALRDDLGGII